MTNFISQHIREEEKEFEELVDKGFFDNRYSKKANYTRIKYLLRSSSLSLVEKIIGQVRGMKKTESEVFTKVYYPDTNTLDPYKCVLHHEEYGFNLALESVALLLEQGLEEIKNNK